jgi:4-amino-4-deoxy-L-arabinose transferase-like glycosyltransferase
LERIVIFATFWQASLDKGGWQNFYNQTQPAAAVFLMKFHEVCDWHPPLYYFLTSVLLFVFKSQWAIYFVQIILAAVTVFLGYKIARLFFSEGIALISAFLLAIEPFWAWHNILLWSENLSIPFTLASFYFFLRFAKSGGRKNIILAAIFAGLDVLTRPNALLLLIFLFFWLIIIFLFRHWLGIEKLFWFNSRQILIAFLIFLSAFFIVLAPWVIRNKIVYGRFTPANILSTNVYFYNLPPFIAMRENISYDDAYRQLQNTAAKNLGENVGDQGDCRKFTKEEFSRQLDFYQSFSEQYILANFSHI